MNDATPAGRQPLLQVRDLCVHFPVHARGLLRRQLGLVKAVDQLGFELMPGETLGLVGESGCGKTTTGRAILRAVQPTRGQVLFRHQGTVTDLAQLDRKQLKPLRPQMQMIFQDPFSSLNPRMTVREIVGEPLVIHGLARGTELEDRVTDMLQRVGLKPEHRTRYPHAFSGGQRQRIGIARALIMRPALVICDEAVSALDVSIQAQVINLLQELQAELGLTYLFIAHDLSVVKHLCDRIAVMYAGRLVELAPTQALFSAPQHPYTTALLASVPNPDPDQKMAGGLTGEVADPGDLPPGCAFHPRCPARLPHCAATVPELAERLAGRCVACHLFGVSAKR